MSELPVKSEPISEFDRLLQEMTDLINSGIVEVAARNPNVLEYMRHWEGRAETAEAALAASDARIAELEAEVERLLAQLQQSSPQPAADGWIAWEGGECPVDADTQVEVRFRYDKRHRKPRFASDVWWHHSSFDDEGHGDIIAYRVVQP